MALARALAPEPAVLLLDEPLSALDAKVREELRGEIRDLQRQLGITTIMVTHDQDEALEMADRIVVMSQGRIAQVGSAFELYAQPVSRFVAEFIGRMNVLRLDRGQQRHRRASRAFRSRSTAPAPGPASGPILVGVRPEELVACQSGGGANRVTGAVEKVVFLGNVTRVTLALADQRLMVELRGRAEGLERGARAQRRAAAGRAQGPQGSLRWRSRRRARGPARPGSTSIAS